MRRRYEYKSMAFAPGVLETRLNLLAKDGWKVIYIHYDPEKEAHHPRWQVLLEREKVPE